LRPSGLGAQGRRGPVNGLQGRRQNRRHDGTMSVRRDSRWRRRSVPVAASCRAAKVRRVPVGCLPRTIALTRLVESSIVRVQVSIPGRHFVKTSVPSAMMPQSPLSSRQVRQTGWFRRAGAVMSRPMPVAMTTRLCFHLYAGPSSKCVAGNTVTELHHASASGPEIQQPLRSA